MEIKRLVVGELETNCYLLISETELPFIEAKVKKRTKFSSTYELGIIDPGGEAEKILKEVRKIKATPKYIINTHCHPDHIFADKEIKEETGAKILIHEAEKNFIDFNPDKFLNEEDEIKIGSSILRVIHTPGHTAGSICLMGENFVFTGDTLFKNGHGRTDLPGGSQKAIEESLEKLSRLLKPGTKVYPGHDEIFKI